MRDGIDETVMLLVTANLTHQKNGIENESGNNQGEHDYAHHQRDHATPLNDPVNIESDRNRNQRTAQYDKKCDGVTTGGDLHGELSVPRALPKQQLVQHLSRRPV